MNRDFAVILQIIVYFFVALSQLLLKKSAVVEYENHFKEYFNIKIALSYFLLFMTTILTMFLLRYLPYKIVSILGTSSYVFVVFLSRFILKERISKRKIMGTLVIITGIIIFVI